MLKRTSSILRDKIRGVTVTSKFFFSICIFYVLISLIIFHCQVYRHMWVVSMYTFKNLQAYTVRNGHV